MRPQYDLHKHTRPSARRSTIFISFFLMPATSLDYDLSRWDNLTTNKYITSFLYINSLSNKCMHKLDLYYRIRWCSYHFCPECPPESTKKRKSLVAALTVMKNVHHNKSTGVKGRSATCLMQQILTF